MSKDRNADGSGNCDGQKSRFQRDLEAAAVSRVREIADAESAALTAGKEKFDLARVEQLIGEPSGSLLEDEEDLKGEYYFLHADVRTLAEYAKVRRELEIWE